jgi:hypothetical protein
VPANRFDYYFVIDILLYICNPISVSLKRTSGFHPGNMSEVSYRIFRKG